MPNIYKITDKNFREEVISNPGIVLVDFWAEWCAPCKMLSPIIEELSIEYKGRIKIGKLNVDENPIIPSQYGISGIPAIIIFEDGKILHKLVGFKPKEDYKKIIDKLI